MNSSSPRIQQSVQRTSYQISPAMKKIARQTVIFGTFVAMGRATLPDGLAPFGAAACAAAYIAKLHPAAILGCIVGAALNMQWASIITMLTFCVGVWTLKQLFQKTFKRTAMFSLFLGEVLAWLIVPHATTYEALMAGLSALAALLLAQLYVGAFKLLQSLRIRKLLCEEEIISLCMLVGTMLLGFTDLEFKNLIPACSIAVCIATTLAALGGAGPGAAAGLALGAMLAIGGHSEYLTILGIVGVTAGGMHHMGKVGSGAGAMLAATVLVFYDRSSYWIVANCAVGTIMFLLIPNKVSQEVGRFVNASIRRESNRKEYLDKLRHMTQIQISEFKEAFKQIGEVFSEPIELSEPVEWDVNALKNICKGCVAERRCWSDVNKLRFEISHILYGGEVPFRLERCQRLDSLCLVSEALVKSAKRENNLREKAEIATTMAGRQLGCVADVMEKMTENLNREVSYDDLLESKLLRALDREGIRAKDAVAQWAGGRLNVRIEGRSCSGQCESKMLKAISQTCGRSMRLCNRECDTICRASFEQSRNFELKVGIAQRAKDGGNIVGDTALSVGLPDGRHLLAISDGMGSGKPAQEESNATISLIHKLFSAGIDRKSAMEAVNRLLLLRSSDEMYSTADICCVDLINGNAELCKLGAPISYWINQDGIHLLRGESLPVGILEIAKADTFRMNVREGDWIILVSDGIVDALGDEAPSLIASLTPSSPKQFSKRLLDLAMSYCVSMNSLDDMTVIAARVEGGLLY